MLLSFDEQAHQALSNLVVLLQEAGGGIAMVMFVQLYLLDMEKIERFNEIFRGYFPENCGACSLPAAAALPRRRGHVHRRCLYLVSDGFINHRSVKLDID